MKKAMYFSKPILLICLAIIFLSSCNVYSPAPFTPVLTENKGEVVLSASVLASPELIGANASITGAVTDKIAIQGNIATNTDLTVNLNGNISYLLNKEDKFKARILVGYANHRIDGNEIPNNRNIDFINWKGNINMPYISPQLSFDRNNSIVGISVKGGRLTSSLDNTIDSVNVGITETFSAQKAFIIEPSIFISDQLDNRFCYVASITRTWIFSSKNNSALIAEPISFPYLKSFLINVGISYDLVRKRNKSD